MHTYTKLKQRKPEKSEMKRLSDICATVLFTVFVIAFFLLIFTYADTLSQTGERTFRIKIKGGYDNKFAVKKYTWKCQNGQCVRFLSEDDGERISLDTCNMMCSKPTVWPKPRTMKITDRGYSTISLESIEFNLPGDGAAKEMTQAASDLFIKNLKLLKPTNDSVSTTTKVSVEINIKDYTVTRLKLNTDERYRLQVNKQNDHIDVDISAGNFFGARHGLETLSQLIWYDGVDEEFRILHDVNIEDFPQFPYRGVMIDTARNFFSLELLKKVVEGMGMSKLNVLHLHLTDAVSFPIVLPSIKELAEFGAYGPDMVYTYEDIKDLIKYARLRGVRVLLEIDAPGHVNAGWNYAEELFNEDYVICGRDDVLNGHLNPDNGEVLKAVQNIYGDLLDLAEDNELFHIGADEVNLSCWRDTEAANSFNNMNEFWLSYTNQMFSHLKKANNGKLPDKVIMWSSPLTDYYNFNLNKNVVIQFWLGEPYNFLSKGYSVIYSTVGKWYLDCGFGPWKPSKHSGNCDPYTPWTTFYTYRPWKEFGYEELTLGGEVCLWTEQVDVDTFETRVWPRSAAFAERVWSDPDVFDEYDVYTRFVAFRDRLIGRGIKNAGIWPRWCSQNPGRC